MMTRGAFFDVDYTILANNSASLYIKYMRQRGEVSLKEIVVSLYYLLQYKLNLLDFEPLAEREVKKIEGQPESEMIELCDEWFGQMVIDYIYPEALDVIQDHRDQGDEIILLSAASKYLVHPLAEHLDIRYYGCNRLEVEDGYFTGRLIKPVCYGAGKIHWAEKISEELGLELQDSYYYSDSITDLPVLEKFGHPIAVNPDTLLRKQAQRRGWQQLQFSMAEKPKL